MEGGGGEERYTCLALDSDNLVHILHYIYVLGTAGGENSIGAAMVGGGTVWSSQKLAGEHLIRFSSFFFFG